MTLRPIHQAKIKPKKQKIMPSARFELTISSLLVRCLTNLAIKAEATPVRIELTISRLTVLRLSQLGHGVRLLSQNFKCRFVSESRYLFSKVIPKGFEEVIDFKELKEVNLVFHLGR